MELFVGLDVPNDVSRELQKIQDSLRRFDRWGKYEPSENYHLTLRYIGEMIHIESVVTQLQRIRQPAFTLQLHELGMFRNDGQNVVWVNVRENDRLNCLKRMIDDSLVHAGIAKEVKPFVPHISLAYYCKPSLVDYFPSCAVEPIPFDTSHFYLYVVERTNTGLYFRKIQTFQLN